MNFRTILLVYTSIYVISLNLFAQTNSKTKLDLLISEIHLFLGYQHQPNTALHQSLMDSLQLYSNQEEYDIAVVFAEMLLDEFREEDRHFQQQTGKINAKVRKFHFDVSIGADLNRQEFEIDYPEKDSLLVDEIQKPFIGLKFDYLLRGNHENGLSAAINLRTDKQNFRTGMDINGSLRKSGIYGKARIGFVYDTDQLYPELSFSEVNAGHQVNYDFSPVWFVRIDNMFRYKNYREENDHLPDFIFDQLRLITGSRGLRKTEFFFSYNLLVNESLKNKNNDYVEHEGLINVSHRLASNGQFESILGFRQRKYTYALQDSLIENNTSAPVFSLGPTIRFPYQIEWRSLYQWMYKTYFYKSEDDPDYFLNEFRTTLRKSFDQGLSFELGYNFEQKTHLYFRNSLKAYIDEQNYTGHGAAFGFDYLNAGNLFISLNGTYTWRRYPYASASNEFGIYSSRNIFNIFFTVQLPLTERLNFNLLLVYDNDKDLDSDHNDYNSTIFSAELRYQF